MIPSVVKGRGVLKEHVCSYANTWADMAMGHSMPLGYTPQKT